MSLKYVDAKLSAQHKGINEGEESQADDRLHNSKTLIIHFGIQEQHVQGLRAIESSGNRLDSMGERVDRFVQKKPASPTHYHTRLALLLHRSIAKILADHNNGTF